jgi:hypothetical protein
MQPRALSHSVDYFNSKPTTTAKITARITATTSPYGSVNRCHLVGGRLTNCSTRPSKNRISGSTGWSAQSINASSSQENLGKENHFHHLGESSVMEDMRSCGAAIIHVEDERRLMDKEAKEHVVLNENVLIEIGAAMALYGRRFILVVKDGVQLPSNLQGLYEVRYEGTTLDGNATIKLLEAINDMKKRSLPQT